MNDPTRQLDPPDTAQLRRIAFVILRDESRIDDVLQEAWLLSRRREPSGNVPRRSWMKGVVRHLALNLRREERRRARRERCVSREERLESTSEIVAKRSVLEFLADAVESLEEPLRTPVRLHFLEGLDVKQVAARLERPIPTIRDQLRRALEQLRGRMHAEFGDSKVLGLALIAAFDWGESEVLRELRPTALRSSAIWIAGGIALVCAAWIPFAQLVRRPTPEAPLTVSPATSSADHSGNPLQSSADGTEEPRTALLEVPASGAEASLTSKRDPSEAHVLRLRVVDRAGAPLAGVMARVSEPGVEGFEPVATGSLIPSTDADGRTSIPISPGWIGSDTGFGEHVSVMVEAEGFVRSDIYVVPMHVAASDEVLVELDRGEVVVEGQALDSLGVALDSGRVALLPIDLGTRLWERGTMRSWWGTSRQDLQADGRFRFSGVRPGIYELLVLHPEQGVARERLEFREPGFHVHDLTLAQGALLRGRVLNDAGLPLEGARVSFEFLARELNYSPFPPAVSASDGSFTLPCMGNVPTTVRATWSDATEHAVETHLVPDAGENSLDLVVQPIVRLSVDVVDRAGAPLPGLNVTAMTGRTVKNMRMREGVTDREGHVDLMVESVEGGEYIALLLRDVKTSAYLPEVVTRVPVGTSRARLRFAPLAPATIAGSVDAVGWMPPSDWSLHLSQTETIMGTVLPLETATGSFLVQGVPPTSYKAYLTAGEALGVPLGAFELVAGETFDLGSRSLQPPGKIMFDWSAAGADSIGRILVMNVKWRLWSSEKLRESPLELLPGDYTLRVERTDGTVRDLPFQVASGEETFLAVEP